MPKNKRKKFVLVSIDDEKDQKEVIRKLRRYLASHKLNHYCSSTAEEMKEYLDKVQNNVINFDDNIDDQQDSDSSLNNKQPVVKASSNQEILEKWARGTFSEGSDAMKLLFGTPIIEKEEPTDQFDDRESENAANNIPQLFMVHSVDSDTVNDFTMVENGRDDVQVVVCCLLCKCPVEIGRNRNTRIRRQAQHVIDSHPKDEFLGVEISKRYQCMHCDRTLPVSKSPCEHISDHHIKNDTETEFRDLWSKEQLLVFNSVLEQCFERHLPVPRSRRLRSGNTWVLATKASYRIVQGDEVHQINTLAEKSRLTADKADNIEKNIKEEPGPSTLVKQEEAHLTDDDYDDSYDEFDSEDYYVNMGNVDERHEKMVAEVKHEKFDQN